MWVQFQGGEDPLEARQPTPATHLGLVQWKKASPRGEAGTSGFLSVSDSDRRVPAALLLLFSLVLYPFFSQISSP